MNVHQKVPSAEKASVSAGQHTRSLNLVGIFPWASAGNHDDMEGGAFAQQDLLSFPCYHLSITFAITQSAGHRQHLGTGCNPNNRPVYL